jgi:predicted peptidase
MRKEFIFPLFLLITMLNCITGEPKKADFNSRKVRIGNKTYPYMVYVPPARERSHKLPILLFLHGAGERGNDGRMQTQVGVGPAIRKNPERFKKLIVVFPQAPAQSRWLHEPASAAMQALDQTIKEFSGDPKRIYLSGISMGGYGAWYLLTEYPDRFAAVVPVCGGIMTSPSVTSVRQLPRTIGSKEPYKVAAKAAQGVPIWIFHGEKDDVIPVSESRQMFEELKRLGARVRYTEYPDVDHNSWDRAYAEPELWKWLLAQSKSS